MNVAAVAQQQPVPELPADPEGDEISDDPAEHAGDKDRPDAQLMRRTGVEGRRDEDRFAGQGNADAFQGDDCGNQPAAVDRYQRGKMVDQFGTLEMLIDCFPRAQLDNSFTSISLRFFRSAGQAMADSPAIPAGADQACAAWRWRPWSWSGL